MTINYQLLQRQRDINTFRNELGWYFIGNIMRIMPLFIQYIYDIQRYNNAQNTLSNQFSTPYEQACAIKTVIELTQKYSKAL